MSKIDWQLRITHADEYYDRWYKKFAVEQGIRYGEGIQWERYASWPSDYKPYTVNMVGTTISIKRAMLLFDKPEFIIKPAPQADAPGFDEISSAQRANLKTIALKSWVDDVRNFFLPETKQAMEDAFYAFGLVEVGYSANFVKNPNAQKPEWADDETFKALNIPEELPDNERVYIKRIHFSQFRVGGRDAYILSRGNWCGYYEYFDFRDAKKAWPRKYSNARFAGYRNVDADPNILADTEGGDDEYKRLISNGDMVKIWKLWDFRLMKIFWYDESNDLVVDDEEFETCFLHALKFQNRRRGFLPIPPIFNWISPQDEINESSEQVRVHRRRASRHYLYNKQTFNDEDELQKMVNGPDGSVTGVDGPIQGTDIIALPMVPMDPAITQSFMQSKDNFNVVTLTGSEQRGEVDRETATAASIKNANMQQAESEPKVIVAEWLSDIARSIILNMAKTTNPFWVKHTTTNNPQEQFGGQVQPNQAKFQQISGEDLEGEDFETSIKPGSVSPQDNQADFQKFIQLISILDQFPEIAASPLLIRMAASKLGVYDENIIAELQKMGQMKMVMAMEQAQQKAQGSKAGQQNMAPATSQQESIRNQLQNQLAPQ